MWISGADDQGLAYRDENGFWLFEPICTIGSGQYYIRWSVGTQLLLAFEKGFVQFRIPYERMTRQQGELGPYTYDEYEKRWQSINQDPTPIMAFIVLDGM